MFVNWCSSQVHVCRNSDITSYRYNKKGEYLRFIVVKKIVQIIQIYCILKASQSTFTKSIKKMVVKVNVQQTSYSDFH